MGNIIIGADFVPTAKNQDLFREGNTEELLGAELCAVLENADYRICNMEVPLTDEKTPIRKCGPALSAPTSAIRGYRALQFDLVTLANNHIMDQGAQGLASTRRLLAENGIAYVGAGDSLREAAKPAYFSFAGKKIGVYACAEHEFSIAGDNTPGANPLDTLNISDDIAAAKARCDYLIVLLHGGKEYYRYPFPGHQRVCRKMIDRGADLVILQHTHCVGCEERYNGGVIVYGQGNFLFDGGKTEFWQNGLLVSVNERMEVSYIPIEKNGACERLSSDPEILRGFSERSAEILVPGAVQEKFDAFAAMTNDQVKKYFYALSGKESKTFRLLNKLTHGKKRQDRYRKNYDARTCLSLIDYIGCESHEELLMRVLEKKTGQ